MNEKQNEPASPLGWHDAHTCVARARRSRQRGNHKL